MAESLTELIEDVLDVFDEIDVTGLNLNVLTAPPDKVNKGQAWVEVSEYSQESYNSRRVNMSAYFILGPITSRSQLYPTALKLMDAILEETKLAGEPVDWNFVRPALAEGSSGEYLAVQAIGYGMVDN